MPEHQKSEDALRQNLEDAGCTEDAVRRFFSLYKEGRWSDAVHFLQKHRCSLLDAIHADQKMLDSLDFLLYQLKKEKEQSI